MENEESKKAGNQLPEWLVKEIRECMQCGTCSGVCSVAQYSDTQGPRKVFAYELGGDHEKALRSKLLWLCTSCHACTENCPKKLHVASIIGRIKQAALDSGRAPSGDAQVRMIRAFAKVVEGGGRISEFAVMSRAMGFRVNEAIGNMPIAMKLMTHGRLKLGTHGIKNKAEMAAMFARMEDEHVG
jgi:heterodisulfide reductase subunit C